MPSNTVKFTPPPKANKERSGHGWGVTIFSAIILIIIVVTFIGAPVVSRVAGENTMTFGSYDGVPIEFVQGNYFAQEVEQLNRYYEQFSQGSSNLAFQRQLVWRQAFEQTALQVGLKREAQKAGIVVTDAKIDQALVTNQNYLKDGKFSEDLYRNTAQADRFRYRQETTTDLLVQQYAADHLQGVLLSNGTQKFIADMAYPQRKFSFVTFTDADFPEASVTDYASKNASLFRTIDVSRITVASSEADANKIRDEAVKGDKTFADLAKAYSKDTAAQSGGALNVKRYYELKSEINRSEDLDKVFGLSKGAISAVIKGDKSWTIYKINAAAEAADLTKQETLAVVRAYLARNERGLVEDTLEAKAKTFASSAEKDFASAAQAAGKGIETTQWVPLNFGNHDLFPSMTTVSTNSIFQGLAANEEFFKKAFRLEVGKVSEPILASPAIIVVRVDAIKTVPEATDTSIGPAAVMSAMGSERSQDLQESILKSPKLQDNFQAEFSRLFRSE